MKHDAVWYHPEKNVMGITLAKSYWVYIWDTWIYGEGALVPHSDISAGWIYVGKM